MKFDDLSIDEQLAFAGLIRLIVRMDGELTPAEVSAVSGLAKEIDAPQLWMMMTDSRSLEMTEVSKRVEAVESREVREWMYGVLVGLAAVDGFDSAETQLLDWLMSVWELQEP
ncbi:MAG: hypothetical protein AAGE52_09265 [Myxococcota bacterium]